MKTWIVLSVLCLAATAYGRGYHMEDDLEDMMMGDDSVPSIILNWDDSCGNKVNELIRLEIESTFQSIAIAVFFRRHNVDVIGMSLMYNAWARKKLNTAKDLMMYLVKRGAKVDFPDISKPAETAWADPGAAFARSFNLESELAQKINDLAKHAEKHNDYHLVSFVEQNLIQQTTDNLFEVASLMNKLSKGGNKFGLMAINQQMVKKYRDFKDCTSDTERYRWNY